MARAPSLLLLEYADIWKELNTRPFSFVGQLDSAQPLVLENLRQISALRSAVAKAVMSITPTADRIERLEKYLECLSAFAAAHKAPGTLDFDYTSPLGGQYDRFQRFPGIACEHALMLHLYAAGLRQAAHEILASMPPPLPPSTNDDNDDAVPPAADSSVAQHTQAAALLRRAAGVYAYLQDGLADGIELPHRRASELVPSMAAALEQLSLAEAQAVTAHRAEVRGSSPSLTAALHAGTADLLEAAAQAVKDAAASCTMQGQRLKKVLALGWALATARARCSWAAAQLEDGAAGAAVGGIDEGTRVLQDCSGIAAECNAWRAVYDDELAALKQAWGTAEQLRESVHFQRLAAPGQLPAGKTLVSALAYQLPPTDLSLFEQ